MDEYLVSVIIPAYNTELYIESMLDCVINQTYKNLEIIIVDDGSTDNTAKIIDNFAEKDARNVAIHIENNGVSNARNEGIELAHGKKIFFWDSDDIIELETIEKVVEFSKNKNVEVVLYSYSNRVNNINDKKHFSNLKEKYEKEEILNELMPHFIGHTYEEINTWIKGKSGLRENKEHTALWRIMLDYEIIKNNNLKFDKNLTLGEDTKFINEYFLYSNSIGFLDNCYYHLTIRDTGANISSITDCKKMASNKLKIISAKERLNKIAKQKFNISISKLSEGTIVFSAIQLAIVSSKDKKYKINERYSTYTKYMEDSRVKKVRNNFFVEKICFKSIPFLFIKNNRYRFLFFIFWIIPAKIINKFV